MRPLLALAVFFAACAQSPAVSGATPEPTAPTFAELAKRSNEATFKASYVMAVSGGGQSVSATQTVYMKPPRYRVDVAMTLGGRNVAQSMYLLPDGVVSCTTEGATTCARLSREEALQEQQAFAAQQQLGTNSDDFEQTYAGTREIAGLSAHCFTVRPKKQEVLAFGDVSVCYSAEAIPLYMKMGFLGAEITLEATSASASVADADFALPVPATQ